MARVEQGRSGRPEAPNSRWRIGADRNEALCLFPRRNQRADKASNTGIEEFHGYCRLEPWNARQRCLSVALNNPDHLECCLIVEKPVLQVDADEIPALQGHYLGRGWRGNGTPGVQKNSALSSSRAQIWGSNEAPCLVRIFHPDLGCYIPTSLPRLE